MGQNIVGIHKNPGAKDSVMVKSKIKVRAGPHKYNDTNVCMFACAVSYKIRNNGSFL